MTRPVPENHPEPSRGLTRRPLATLLCLLLIGGTGLTPDAEAQTRNTDPKKTLKEQFWGQLYKDGGTTLFCGQTFDRKSVLVGELHVYSTTWMRDSLGCGTPWQCRERSTDYQRMASDMHNIFPEEARFELERRSAKFEELPSSNETEGCGYRRSFGIIDPPDSIKGEIARALLYMHTTYGLPLYGDLNQLKRWNRMDPPSEDEKARNLKIADLQGNENPFITYPEQAEIVTAP